MWEKINRCIYYIILHELNTVVPSHVTHARWNCVQIEAGETDVNIGAIQTAPTISRFWQHLMAGVAAESASDYRTVARTEYSHGLLDHN